MIKVPKDTGARLQVDTLTTSRDLFSVSLYAEHKDNFDDLLQAVSDYFELFRKNTDKLEDLFLQLLEHLGLDTPTAITQFESLHH